MSQFDSIRRPAASATFLRFFFLLLLGLSLHPLRAQTNIIYPANAGVINVKNAPYNAKGDGITDDTQAIQAALSAGVGGHAIVYLPNGTYLVSSTLRWKNSSANNGGWDGFLSIQGQSQSGTIIKLQDNLPAFANPAAPAAVLMTGSRDGEGKYSDLNGEGNQAFENSILNLTVDVGAGNPGAVGVDYQVSNWGAMRNVTVRTSDPAKAGLCGVSLLRRDNGPGIIEKVTIEGFQYGIRAGQEIAQFTLEHITLSGQSVVGIEDNNAIMAIRKLTSTNTVPALRVGGNALLNLLEANLSGGTSSGSAIEFTGSVSRGYLRGITTSGYASALRRNGTTVAGASVTEWVSDPVLGANSGGKLSLNLPIEETPEYFDSNLSNWAYVGPPFGSDATAAIQAAMNSGKSTVYFGRGSYNYSNTITVPATVRHIIGMGSVLRSTVDMARKPLFKFEGGTEPVVLERFELNARNGYLVEHASPRTVVIQDIGSFEGDAYRNGEGAGKLFINDITCKTWRFNYPQQVWARQYNPEGDATYAVNNGGALWVLGFKVENSETLFDTRNGGSTEAFGGFAYTFGDRGKPALINNGSKVAVSFAGVTYVPNGTYTVLAREISGTQRQDTPTGSAYGGRTYSVPMYVSMLPRDQPFYRINAGGAAVFPYQADAYFSGNTGTYSTTDPIDASGIENPAPQPVYQSELNDLTGPGGSFTYTFPKLTPGTEYRIRLHFVERSFSEAGKRTFHVAVNDSVVLPDFDIFAAAGAKDKALVKVLTGTAREDSTLVLTFTSVTDRALVNGIEVLETEEAVTFRRADNPGTVASGLQYEYYEGDWKKLPDFKALTALKTGTVPGFDLSVKNRPDGFGIRYTGYLDVPRDGVYTFFLGSNDGSKLFIGTRELINNDSIHDLVEKSASIGLKAGKHALSVLFFDQKGEDQLQLSYQGPGIARQPVPAGALFHVPVNEAGAGKGLLAEYYNNATLAHPAVLTRTEGPVKFDWHAVSPAPGTVSKDNFSVRWTGQVQAPVTGNYTFRVPVDKGNTVRLWVNNVLLLNSWAGPAPADSAVLSLRAGDKYDLMLEYSSQKTLASLELQWAYPGQGFQAIPQKRLFPAVAGAGLQGEYFADADFGAPALTRVDAAIGFDWGAGSPAPEVPADNFSVRWTGTVQPRYGETYTFFLTSGQAGRLWVDDRLILDKPAGTPLAPSAPVALAAGRKYKVRVEYVALTGNAAVTLAWQSASQFRETVPTSRLYPYEDGTGLTAQYYGQMNLKGLRLTRIDPTVNFDWGGGSPAPGVIGVDAYSVRWSGSIRPRHSETHTFYINSDNGRRVWVNDQLIIDQWIDNWGVTYTGTIALEAGKLYKIRVEYFENFGGAGIRLEWSSPSQAREVIPQSQLYPAPVFAPQFAGGVYRVEPKNAPGLRLNVAGGSSIRGANINVATADGSAAQDWEVTLVGGDFYEFTPLCAPDNRMDVAGARSADGTNVSTWVGYFPGNGAQQWRLIPQGDGYYALAPQHAPGSRLEVAGGGTASGTNVHIWSNRATDNDRQLWRLAPRDGSARVAAENNSVPAGDQSRLRVYPNPSAGATNIAFTPEESGPVSLLLFDARGKLVQRVFEGAAEAGVAQRHAVQGQALKDGLYMIRLNTATGTVSRKLVITK